MASLFYISSRLKRFTKTGFPQEGFPNRIQSFSEQLFCEKVLGALPDKIFVKWNISIYSIYNKYNYIFKINQFCLTRVVGNQEK